MTIENRVHFCFNLSRLVYDHIQEEIRFNIYENRLEVRMKEESNISVKDLMKYLSKAFGLKNPIYHCFGTTAYINHYETEQSYIILYKLTKRKLEKLEALVKVSI